MATMNLELSDAMAQWLDEATVQLGCAGPEEVLHRLIAREQLRKAKIADMQRLVDEALAQPTIEMTTDEILAEVRERAKMRRRNAA